MSTAVPSPDAQLPPGTPVRYWTGWREGDGKVSRTRTEVHLLGGHTSVVWVEDESSCIALTHIEVMKPADILAGIVRIREDGLDVR